MAVQAGDAQARSVSNLDRRRPGDAVLSVSNLRRKGVEMPASQRGQVDRVKPGQWRLRYYVNGKRFSKQPFTSKSAAVAWYREHIERQGNGQSAPRPELTFSEFVGLYLERHAASVRPRTISTLTERLRHAERSFGEIRLGELQGMVDEIAGWHARQPSGVRYARMQALRQTCGAAVRWGHMTMNPAKGVGRNPQPPARAIRVFTNPELDAIAAELSPMYRPLPVFGATTGLRTEEWQALERRDVDRKGGVLRVGRTVSEVRYEGCEHAGCKKEGSCQGHPAVVGIGKNSKSRREVPLSSRAIAALDDLPPRLDVALLFPSPTGGLLHLDNFRHREWAPAIEASGVQTPARIYDLRSTFASNALAAGISVFELARVMGNSVEMIERHYGRLLDGSAASIAGRLNAFAAEQGRASDSSEIARAVQFS